ncbi:MAG: HTH domain-containing protein [Dysgonamonadaceae bacterium]|jgi:phage regulator Rha-like protein|nr:HTH domain-containing protein [Dysgonamonadaceae bacterium]
MLFQYYVRTTKYRISKIIALIKNNNHISTAKMATILSVSRQTILRDIEKLKQSYGRFCFSFFFITFAPNFLKVKREKRKV